MTDLHTKEYNYSSGVPILSKIIDQNGNVSTSFAALIRTLFNRTGGTDGFDASYLTLSVNTNTQLISELSTKLELISVMANIAQINSDVAYSSIGGIMQEITNNAIISLMNDTINIQSSSNALNTANNALLAANTALAEIAALPPSTSTKTT